MRMTRMAPGTTLPTKAKRTKETFRTPVNRFFFCFFFREDDANSAWEGTHPIFSANYANKSKGGSVALKILLVRILFLLNFILIIAFLFHENTGGTNVYISLSLSVHMYICLYICTKSAQKVFFFVVNFAPMK